MSSRTKQFENHYATSASVGEPYSLVAIDEVGNIRVGTNGTWKNLATMLRMIAADITDDNACICTPAIAGISDGPNVDCSEHGESSRKETA